MTLHYVLPRGGLRRMGAVRVWCTVGLCITRLFYQSGGLLGRARTPHAEVVRRTARAVCSLHCGGRLSSIARDCGPYFTLLPCRDSARASAHHRPCVRLSATLPLLHGTLGWPRDTVRVGRRALGLHAWRSFWQSGMLPGARVLSVSVGCGDRTSGRQGQCESCLPACPGH